MLTRCRTDMSTDHLKKPFVRTINDFAEGKIAQAIQKLGKALPCVIIGVDGAIVTVAFQVTSGYTLPNVTVPTSQSKYIREPYQVGDLGVVFPADVSIAGVSGLVSQQGVGLAGLVQPANLSALMFFPAANKDYSTEDPNAVTLRGPNGAVIKDVTNASSIVLTPTGITMTCGGHTIVINSTGVIIDGKVFLTHEHSGVMSGGDDTGPVV